MDTVTRNLRFSGVEAALDALGKYGTSSNGYIRLVYTRQSEEDWRYFMGQCVLGEEAPADLVEFYPKFAFVTKKLHGATAKALLQLLAGDGLDPGSGLPRIRMPGPDVAWRSEVVPSHASASGSPARRFTLSVANHAFIPESHLVAYDLPYRSSASAYIGTFMGLKPFHGSDDGRKGEFSIQVPDQRGSIVFADGTISIRNRVAPLRLVGTINDAPIDIRGEGSAPYDQRSIEDVELWLIAEGTELVDYFSTTAWPHKFDVPQSEAAAEDRLLTLIRRGEGETCEFKEYIDLTNQKAGDIEKTVCAFSNQRGGTLFIGVDDEGEILGVARGVSKRSDQLDKALADYERSIRKRLTETLKDSQCFKSRLANIASQSLIVIEVEARREVNYLIGSNIAYIRHRATSAKMSPLEIRAKGGANNAESAVHVGAFGQ